MFRPLINAMNLSDAPSQILNPISLLLTLRVNKCMQLLHVSSDYEQISSVLPGLIQLLYDGIFSTILM